MNQKSEIIPLLRQEEGVEYTPYIDSLGYPTTGVGFKLGPQNVPLNHYTFNIDDNPINAWLQSDVDAVIATMQKDAVVSEALTHCNQPRQDILTSMAYQMGESGLDGFHNMLAAINAENWDEAAAQMLDST
ncbi:glycoside hydrolase family protein [Salmonella bongori]|uniref:glycoside hydrolase family protein n=1 Tax=Salmonella bongori TaxID=54736 RepID=UPI00215E9C26|nr:glycoside hydrolase family protein [Salmonella bongori]